MSGGENETTDLPALDPTFEETVIAMSSEERVAFAGDLMRRFQVVMMLQEELMTRVSSDVMKRVELLLEIQGQYDRHLRKYMKEKVALEAKYQKIFEPLLARRYEIVSGIEEVESEKKDAKGKAPMGDNAPKGIPSFWLTAMKNNVVLAEQIQMRDEGALEHLKDIKWCKTTQPKGFKLDFVFDSNPYFQNHILTKTYQLVLQDEHFLEKAMGTTIDWYPGKCLTQKNVKKKSKKGSKHALPVTKIERCKSFFNFFNPPEIPGDDVEIADEAVKKMQNRVDQDYDILSTIRDKIIPRAVLWYTGDGNQSHLTTYLTDFKDENDDEKEDKGKGKMKEEGGSVA